MSIEITDLTFSFGASRILDRLSLEVPQNSVTCLLGPSGCGKTTLLKLLAGLGLPEGRLEAGAVRGLGEGDRIGFVFQEPRLLGWRTLYENLDLVIPKTLAGEERRARIRGVLERFGLEDYSLSLPSRLSGGMKQRASLARALVFGGEYLFMDEPFQGLDPRLKENLINDFLSWKQKLPQTVLLVTHDTREAAVMGDRIYLLTPRPGRVCRSYENLPASQNRSAGEKAALAEELYRVMAGT
ncbi:MAG: ABC transporter ATP-binding protein [Spirochaetales bacterium]|nr:ABC transporter ATP-binding protein [Spirochaetales bacterium]